MIITRETTLENHNLDTLKNSNFNDFFYWFRKNYNCKYMTYLLEDLETKSVFFISTNAIWQEELTNHRIINDCPIYKIAKNIHSLGLAPIIWNYLRKNESKADKDLNNYRAEFDVANGVGFVNNMGRYRENFCFATDKKDKNFAERILSNNLHSIGLEEFRKLQNKIIIK